MKSSNCFATPAEYIASLEEPRKSEIVALDALIREVCPQLDPHLRAGMLGYGTYQYKYRSGRAGEWCRLALASSKQYISLYACVADENGYIAERYRERLPKASIGKSCVRFKKRADLDEDVLRELLQQAATATMFGV